MEKLRGCLAEALGVHRRELTGAPADGGTGWTAPGLAVLVRGGVHSDAWLVRVRGEPGGQERTPEPSTADEGTLRVAWLRRGGAELCHRQNSSSGAPLRASLRCDVAGLRALQLADVRRATVVDAFACTHLQSLTVSGSNVTRLANLPDRLAHLAVEGCPTVIDRLPPGLRSVHLAADSECRARAWAGLQLPGGVSSVSLVGVPLAGTALGRSLLDARGLLRLYLVDCGLDDQAAREVADANVHLLPSEIHVHRTDRL